MNRVAYFVLQSITDADGNYVPCIATEGVSGYHRTDWQWGKDFELAQECVNEKNAALGLTQHDVDRIVASSMAT